MLRSDDFSSKAKVDRYGRKLPKDAGRKDLERYYRTEDEDDEADGAEDDEEVEKELRRVKDEGEEPESSSSEESEDDMLEEEEEEAFGLMGDQDAEEVPMGEVTSRVAVVNLDWDNIRSMDLLAVFSSFVPTGGRILKVSVYPSNFGKERMKREEMEGPPKEIFGGTKLDDAQDEGISSSKESDEEDLDDEAQNDEKIKQSILKEDQGNEFNSASLRRYQLSRLRYYYAVLICSSPSVAEAIYTAVDGTEYLTSANFFDLRFVPDDTDFGADKPRDECERIPDGYRPNEFVTDALQHSKVRLTWDADDCSRKEAQKRAFSGSRADIDENDLKAYLGSDSEQDDNDAPEPVIVDATAAANPSDELVEAANATLPAAKLSKKEAERQRMRSLLGLQPEPATKKGSNSAAKAPVGDMQITFTSGLSGKGGSVFENQPPPEREETTVEKYIRKEKERKTRRKDKTKSSRDQDPEQDVPTVGGEKATTNNADAGFDDPFFTAPATTSATLKKSKKRALQKSASPDPDAAAQRANLLALTASDTAANGGHEVQHFDSALLAKGEKLAKQKKKRKQQQLSERQKAALEAREKDAFEVDVQDARFAAVFEQNEFAIDPSHRGYKGTEGMKRLLAEGRRKRGLDGEGSEVRPGKRGREEGEDVASLVQRVKRRMK